MKGTVWVYHKTKEGIEYRFQINGIRRGAYTKVLDPIFKGWHNVASGYNHKDLTEVMIYSGSFPSEDDMIKWVKKTVEFPTVYSKCDSKCTIKILVKDKNEVKNDAKKRVKAGTIRKGKATSVQSRK